MEESTEVNYAENKAFLEKNKKKRFKTPSQLQALEEFYNEHNYPTESMKAEVAEKIGLTEKQISGWFCHRRVKDRKKEETLTPGKQDLSSDVIHDRGSGLRQDSCSSTKQDRKVVEVREVESQRLCRDDFPSVVLNYEPKRLDDGTVMNDTSSESNSALQETFCPQNRNPFDVETTEYQAPKGFVPKYSGRVGPSGYLKIKGHTENAAITAVKRQLGRHYREDGPPLGIEFDQLPPESFESPSKNADNDTSRILEPIASCSLGFSGIHKRSGFSNIEDLETYAKPTEHRPLHNTDQENFSYSLSKQKHSFPFQNRGFPRQKFSNGVDSYSAKETSEYDSRINHSILNQHDPLGMSLKPYADKHPHAYSRKLTNGLEESRTTSYDDVNLKVVRKRERFVSRHVTSAEWHKDRTNIEDRMRSTGILKDEGLYMDRRATIDHYNPVKAGKRGREEFLQKDYAIRTSTQEPSQWRSAMEMPRSFNEDETAETNSSVD